MSRLVLVPVGEAVGLKALGEALLPGMPLSELWLGDRLDPAPAHDPVRGQVHSGDLLGLLLQATRPAPGDRVLGVASADLFIPILTFVFGEAELNGQAAVFSTARLDPRFYGLPPDPGLLLLRSVKEARHELGHTYGLIHCREPDCVMRASTDADGVDVKSAGFCRACSRQLRRS